MPNYSKSLLLKMGYWIIICLPLFLFLGSFPLIIFDESRVGINAYMMNTNGWSLITYFGSEPDLWNTKPPLLIWIQTLFFKLFGMNEWSFRLPSAIAGLAIAVLLHIFLLPKNKLIAYLAPFVLITTLGFVTTHVTRTGDYDSLMCFWILSYTLAYYTYGQTQKSKYLYMGALAVALAVLTKSIAGLLCLPGLALYLIIDRKAISLLKNKSFYFSTIIACVLIRSFYYFRELQAPGYLQAVYENELGGRFLNTLEENAGTWDFYIKRIKMPYWILFLALAPMTFFYTKSKNYRSIVLLSALIIGTHLLIISTSETKLNWYIAPNYMFTALIVSIFIGTTYETIKQKNTSISNKWLGIALTLLLIPPYITLLNTLRDAKEVYLKEEYALVKLVDDAQQQKRTDLTYIYNPNYDPNLVLKILFAGSEGLPFHKIYHINDLQPGMKVIAQMESAQKKIESKFSYKIIDVKPNNIKYYVIEQWRHADTASAQN